MLCDDACGVGYDGAELYDPDKGESVLLPPMPSLRATHGAALFTHQGKPYVVVSGTSTRQSDLYDVQEKKWIQGPQQLVSRAFVPWAKLGDSSLLVMGGFGHARAREFVLGGATQRMLEAPPCPILMSH